EAAGGGGKRGRETRVPAIRFEDVSFRYPGRDDDVFMNLNLVVEPGESVAIVGENGVGKTTLIKLLAGFYRPSAGRVLIDGIDLDELDLVAWRRRLGVIFQDFVHFELSARDNIALAGLDEPGVDEDARAAAQAAGASEIIETLPSGWDSMLSRNYTGGAELSGGQWQRVALARALFAARRGAQVLVLDEPTANLDVHAETELFDQLLEHARGMTAIVISHRYSTVRRAARIVVLADGGVIEDGGHDSLLALDGVYARLYRLQADRFVMPDASPRQDPNR
ncbi:MAG: ATP-binding cassette domain-containing protein, partial [Acidimicrobiia bacterium]